MLDIILRGFAGGWVGGGGCGIGGFVPVLYGISLPCNFIMVNTLCTTCFYFLTAFKCINNIFA